MGRLILLAFLALAAIPVAPQNKTGTIEGRVTRQDQSIGIPNVQVTLQGPNRVITSEELSAWFPPDPSMNPAMRSQIDAMISLPQLVFTLNEVAAAVTRMQNLGAKIPAAALTAISQQAPLVNVQTDSGGNFRFENLAAGRYQLRAQREGYFAPPVAGYIYAVLPTATSTLTIVDGQTTPKVSFSLIPSGTVSGIVRNPSGQPATGLQVNACQLAYSNGRAYVVSVNTNTTNDRGEYRLFGLPPGEYYVVVTPQKAIPISALQNPFAKTFYPSAVDGRDARPVLVREGEEVAAVDIGLRGGVATISGRIVTPTGQPIPRTASFYLSPVDSKILTDSLLPSVQNSARNRTDGQFEIQGVLPGDYDLIATSSSSNNVPALWGRTRINVVSSGASDITVKLLAGIDVKVRMTVDGGPPPFTAAASILRPSIALNLRSVEPYGRSSEGMVNPNSKFDATGVYVFPGVPELRYYVQPASLPPNAYIADVQVGETSVYDNGFDVGNISGTIEMKVLTNGGRIQGSVLDAAKKPVGYAVVALVPEQSRRQNTSLYKVLISDLQGSFTITGIAPGEYKLFAWEAVSRDAPLNPEFIAKFESLGQRVTIAAAESSKVDLNLIPKS